MQIPEQPMDSEFRMKRQSWRGKRTGYGPSLYPVEPAFDPSGGGTPLHRGKYSGGETTSLRTLKGTCLHRREAGGGRCCTCGHSSHARQDLWFGEFEAEGFPAGSPGLSESDIRGAVVHGGHPEGDGGSGGCDRFRDPCAFGSVSPRVFASLVPGLSALKPSASHNPGAFDDPASFCPVLPGTVGPNANCPFPIRRRPCAGGDGFVSRRVSTENAPAGLNPVDRCFLRLRC
jgi:hypothetical protein